jgi:hypothetical protein
VQDGSGRPPGWPRIATSAYRDVSILRTGGQRPSSGTAEDRNSVTVGTKETGKSSGRPPGWPRIATLTWSGVGISGPAAAVLRDSRGSQPQPDVGAGLVPGGSGRPPGQPRIATTQPSPSLTASPLPRAPRTRPSADAGQVPDQPSPRTAIHLRKGASEIRRPETAHSPVRCPGLRPDHRDRYRRPAPRPHPERGHRRHAPGRRPQPATGRTGLTHIAGRRPRDGLGSATHRRPGSGPASTEWSRR